jgi:hypothetical protein
VGFGGGDRGTWVRAIPGEYRVRITVAGEALEEAIQLRQDPNVPATPQEMATWLAQARKIEEMECTARSAGALVRSLDQELEVLAETELEPEIRRIAETLREELRPVFLGFVGDARDPGHVNLPGRINWLTIQVGNYAGRPTRAQLDWIDRYSRMTQEYKAQLDEIMAEALPELNRKLREAGLAEIGGS